MMTDGLEVVEHGSRDKRHRFNFVVKMTSGASGGSLGPVKPSASWKGEGRAHFPFCPEISKYEKLAKVGQGTFG